MRNRWILLALVLTIAGIFVIGCYTIMSHPRVEGEEEQSYSGSYYREHCTDCHQDYHQYPYGYYYGYYPEYYWDYPRWGHYYAYPWWWDWYYNDDNGGGGGGGVTIPEKKGERRRTLEPPYVPGGSITSPVVTGSKSSRGEPSVGTIETGKVKEGQPQQKEEKKENTEERKEGKGQRR